MKITFLIGNGFDLSLGLKTSYNHFYSWYCQRKSNKQHICDFKDNINDDMNNDVPIEKKTWADFEIGLGEYTKNFTKENVNNYLECFNDAQNDLIEYLREQENQFDVSSYSKDRLSEFEESIKNFYDETFDTKKTIFASKINDTHDQNIEIRIISFNYTNILDRIMEHLPDLPFKAWNYGSQKFSYRLNKNILHIHGSTYDYPILGVNDESNIKNKELLNTPLFKTYLIKANKIEELGKKWSIDAEQLISQSSVVCIYGMSLGSSDAKWWRKLIQWLKTNSSRHVIIFWHEDTSTNDTNSNLQLYYINKAKSKLLSYSALTDEETEKIKQQIHVVINAKKFLLLKRDIDCTIEEFMRISR